MSPTTKKEKFDLDASIKALGINSEVANLLEKTRPLSNGSLRVASKKAEYIKEVLAFATDADPVYGLTVTTEMTAYIVPDLWSSAVIKGAAYLAYQGRYTAQRTYSVLCQAAGSCLRAPAAEPFRLALSIVTRAGLRPVEVDESPYLDSWVSELPIEWEKRARTYASLEEVKGSAIAECLAAGLGCFILEGRVTHEEAGRLFRETAQWRASSPIPQLLRKEVI